MADPVVLSGGSMTLAYGPADGTGTPIKVGNRVSLEDSGRPRQEVDTTVMPDTAGAIIYKTKRVSDLVDSGTWSLKLYYNPADTSHQFLLTNLVTPSATSARKWTLTLADGTTWASIGYVTDFKPSGLDVQDTSNIVADVTITRSGAITITPAGGGGGEGGS